MSKYVDTSAIIQVIGSVYKNPELLDDSRYHFIEDDFPEKFHRILFGTIYNLHLTGAKKININTIEDYLLQRPKQYAVFKTNKGKEYLQNVLEKNLIEAFDFYYNRLKKMSLLRVYDELGLKLDWLYDIDNIFDSKKKQEQEDYIDHHTVVELDDIINTYILTNKEKCLNGELRQGAQAGEGIEDLLESLKNEPAVGYPLYGPLINTVTRGARLKKFYIRSGATGLGKTRTLIADACNFACNEIYKNGKWSPNGTKEPTLFISTEQELNEVQTMMLAFISNVEEDHILLNKYEKDEEARVYKAAQILSNSPLHVVTLPNFTLKDIENTIKIAINEWGVKYIAYDYIHSSIAILSDISSQAGIKGLREDNVLFMLATRLKDICNEYGVFIISATQLNGSYKDAEVFDQNLLRGAKSISDKIDAGMIMLTAESDDLEGLKPLLDKYHFQEPDIKMAIYKNRGNKYTNMLLWCKANKGTCRIEPIFATDYSYRYLPIEDTEIGVIERGKV